MLNFCNRPVVYGKDRVFQPLDTLLSEIGAGHNRHHVLNRPVNQLAVAVIIDPTRF